MCFLAVRPLQSQGDTDPYSDVDALGSYSDVGPYTDVGALGSYSAVGPYGDVSGPTSLPSNGIEGSLVRMIHGAEVYITSSTISTCCAQYLCMC